MKNKNVFEFLESRGLFRINPSLGRIQDILQDMNLANPPYKIVQIVGTNGKGSTSSFLSALAIEHGLNVGLHTSPHFLSPRERIRINGNICTEALWQKAFMDIVNAGGKDLSYFECITCIAMKIFTEYPVDLAIMETGLGGTWDATTALRADLVLFTSIDKDHEDVLGKTIAEIARDKAGAIRPKTGAISIVQQAHAGNEIANKAAKSDSPVMFVQPQNCDAKTDSFVKTINYPTYPPKLALQGVHQQANSALALAGWRYLVHLNKGKTPHSIISSPELVTEPENKQAEASGLAKAWLAGRLQFIPAQSLNMAGEQDTFLPSLILDGAHNPCGLASLGLSLAQQEIAPIAIIFSCLKDKDVEAMTTHLRSFATGPIFVPPIANNERAMNPKSLAKLIGLNAIPADSMKHALELCMESIRNRMPEVLEATDFKHPLLICGSLYLLSEFYSLFPNTLENPKA